MPASRSAPSDDPTPMDHQPHSPPDPAPPEEEEDDEYDNSGEITNSFRIYTFSTYHSHLFTLGDGGFNPDERINPEFQEAMPEAQFWLFRGCRTRSELDCDVFDAEPRFSLIPQEIRALFPPPPFKWSCGWGYIGHRSVSKVGDIAICSNTAEAMSHIDPEMVAGSMIWIKIGAVWYVLKTTNGREYYCSRHLIDEAIKEYNIRREAKLATKLEQEHLQFIV